MAADVDLDVAHVLFMDVVGYSKLLINDQTEVLAQLSQIVLIRLATGDGMALIFSTTPKRR
jgi:hypothetical protein